jgi:hypothetical protein
MSYGSAPRFSAEVGTGATMCHMALDLTSRLRWAPALPLILWLRTSSPSRGGLQRYHVPYSSGPYLPVEVGSSATTCRKAPDPAFSVEVGSGTNTCLVAPDLTFRLIWALVSPRVLRLQTPHPCRGGLRRCHASCGSQWATNLVNKERHSRPTYVARLTCF